MAQAGSAGLVYGRLLARIAGKFEAFITVDQTLPAQQPTANLPFGVVVLRAPANRLSEQRGRTILPTRAEAGPGVPSGNQVGRGVAATTDVPAFFAMHATASLELTGLCLHRPIGSRHARLHPECEETKSAPDQKRPAGGGQASCESEKLSGSTGCVPSAISSPHFAPAPFAPADPHSIPQRRPGVNFHVPA